VVYSGAVVAERSLDVHEEVDVVVIIGGCSRLVGALLLLSVVYAAGSRCVELVSLGEVRIV